MTCCYCLKPVDELKDSHVSEGFPDRRFWHIPCYNEAHADAPDEYEERLAEWERTRPQTLADVGMCEADFR